MANTNERPELEDPPKTATVWEHYGFPVNHSENLWIGDQIVCHHCSAEVGYVCGNTEHAK